jgi:hypothetical protein
VAANITTDADSYTIGATVTFNGTGWFDCSPVKIDLFGSGGFTVASGITPVGGVFTGTFTAPGPAGVDLLYAYTPGSPSSVCHATTAFSVTP